MLLSEDRLPIEDVPEVRHVSEDQLISSAIVGLGESHKGQITGRTVFTVAAAPSPTPISLKR